MKYLLVVICMTIFNSFVSAQTQFEMNLEASENYKKADAELNKVYKQLVNILDADTKNLLKKAQLDWIKYRDSHCAFEGNVYEGGSAQPMAISMCLETVTRTRTHELQVSLEERSEK